MIKHSPKWIYLMRVYENDGSVSYKIGYTKNDPKKRIPQLQTGNKNKIEILETFWSEYSTRLEATLKSRFKIYNESGEWFNLPKEIVDDFISICESYENNFKIILKENTYLQDKYTDY